MRLLENRKCSSDVVYVYLYTVRKPKPSSSLRQTAGDPLSSSECAIALDDGVANASNLI
jgi:hypothetical protein